MSFRFHVVGASDDTGICYITGHTEFGEIPFDACRAAFKCESFDAEVMIRGRPLINYRDPKDRVEVIIIDRPSFPVSRLVGGFIIGNSEPAKERVGEKDVNRHLQAAQNMLARLLQKDKTG